MNEKKKRLFDSGMKLFASKGYHRTSIQEITNEAGVSKGSFYVYFQSKEEFMLTAYQHFYSQMKERIERVRQVDLSPKESLAKQINVWMQYIYDHKDFIMMHLRENISIAGSVDELTQKIKVDSYHWMRENIEAIYGPEEMKPNLVDTVIQLEGLLQSYLKWKLHDEVDIEIEKLGPFLVRRLDDLVKGMRERQEEALVVINQLPHTYEKRRGQTDETRSLPETILELKEKLQGLALPDEKINQLYEVIDLLEAEVGKENCQPVLIQGLLAHFNPIAEVEQECQEIARLLDVKLLP
ncbi:DNA-binding transcriptional regulator, AcrR family [Mesobacillus persicus]|uniref:DNA-binding transcriptional regulator, AcrR family n=2 Tax=Mesobacillus persicus TaxID=930146 RepID=A0A1H8G9J7_9BACI|nr:DNA-binding transcriptional regulator, AcrR family [Mesobacillus persicus]